MRTEELHVNCSICWLPRGRWNFSKYFTKLFLNLAEIPLCAPHGQGLGRDPGGGGGGGGGGEQRVYVFTAKSGWELARIIVYNPATQSREQIPEETPRMLKCGIPANISSCIEWLSILVFTSPVFDCTAKNLSQFLIQLWLRLRLRQTEEISKLQILFVIVSYGPIVYICRHHSLQTPAVLYITTYSAGSEIKECQIISTRKTDARIAALYVLSTLQIIIKENIYFRMKGLDHTWILLILVVSHIQAILCQNKTCGL